MNDVTDIANCGFDCPPFERQPSIYVLATQPRCGSHMVAHVLRRSGRAGVPLEYFHPREWEAWMARVGTDNPSMAFLELCRLRTTANGNFGVKCHFRQFDRAMKQGLGAFLKPAVFLYLVRYDLLGQAISHVIAAQTGNWIAGQSASPATPVFSAERIRDAMQLILTERSRWERFFATNGIVPHRFVYEDICADSSAHMQRLFAAIGAAWDGSAAAPPRLQRTTINSEWRRRFLEEANTA